MVAWWLDYVVGASPPKKKREMAYNDYAYIYSSGGGGGVVQDRAEQAHQKSSTKNKGARQKESLLPLKKNLLDYIRIRYKGVGDIKYN